jgi:hypothetical protein
MIFGGAVPFRLGHDLFLFDRGQLVEVKSVKMKYEN